MIIHQISVFLENRTGQLADIAFELNEAGINMLALNIAEASEYGLIRIIADDSDRALTVLKDKGFLATVSPVVSVSVPDRPGGLYAVAKAVGEAGINIEYMYSMIREKDGIAYMIFKTNDPETLEQTLVKKGFF